MCHVYVRMCVCMLWVYVLMQHKTQMCVCVHTHLFIWNIIFFSIFVIYFVKMQIIDEKSLIKKYQNEIRCLKEELEQLKRGIVTIPQLKEIGEDVIVLLKQKVHFFCVDYNS